MSRKDAINNLFLKRPEAISVAPKSPAPKDSERVRTGAISAMGASLQELADNAKQATLLRKQIADGEIWLETSKIVGSRITDRIPIDVDPKFDELVESVRENGQQVPILVRPHPDTPGMFEIAYGRRRMRVADILNRPVLAIIRDLADRELIIAQGRENSERTDLSFIEKAFFAKNLEEDGCDRATIIAALASDKADISRYITVARRVPEDIVRRIGPAPKMGRARWLALADLLEIRSASVVAEQVLEDPSIQNLDSDTRFQSVLRALQGRPRRRNVGHAQLWKTPQGKDAARIETRGGKTALVFEEKIVPAFATFVTGRLDSLYREFQHETKKEEGEG
ncbi:plasmid partitioning protein RepB [Aquamicrobium segne]|uniref:Plasmid partitioning protein RepB n=1 Tax=Aquamicrobium segne TaxID=469547 RepID=A0ABW0H201_9HYPH